MTSRRAALAHSSYSLYFFACTISEYRLQIPTKPEAHELSITELILQCLRKLANVAAPMGGFRSNKRIGCSK